MMPPFDEDERFDEDLLELLDEDIDDEDLDDDEGDEELLLLDEE